MVRSIHIEMYSGLSRTDKSKAKYKPESSTQKGRVNPPLRGEAYETSNGREGEGGNVPLPPPSPPSRREGGRGKSNPPHKEDSLSGQIR